MSKHDRHIAEDMTAVANVAGLTTDPIGLKSKTAPVYKKDNLKTKIKTLKEWIESEKAKNI